MLMCCLGSGDNLAPKLMAAAPTDPAPAAPPAFGLGLRPPGGDPKFSEKLDSEFKEKTAPNSAVVWGRPGSFSDCFGTVFEDFRTMTN